MKRIFRIPELYLAFGIFSLFLLSFFGSAQVDDVRLVRNGEIREASFPISEKMDDRENFEITFTWSPGILENSRLDIHPDDCVDSAWVNGISLDLEKYPGHCSWSQGFSIPFSDLRTFGQGKKEIRFAMHNGSGLAGILLEVKSDGFSGAFLRILLYLLTGTLLFCVARRFRVEPAFAAIFLLGIMIRFFYVQETNFEQRTHDVSGHIDYVGIVAEEHHIPAADECWTCYHPPVYYATSALTWNVANLCGIFPQRTLQWESFLFSVFCLFLGLSALRLFLGKEISFFLAGILWAFWPSVVFTAARIGNDSLFYLAHLACFWMCLRYLLSHKGKFLAFAAVFAGISFATKSTGAVSIATYCVTVFLGFFGKSWHRPDRSEKLALILGSLVCAASGIFLLTHDISGNVSGLKWVDVGNGPENYLIFDLKTFLLQPYTSPFDDAMGRQYFWNYLLKTSLFGEFRLLETPWGIFLATSLSVLLLLLVYFCLRGIFYTKWNRLSLLFGFHGILFVAAALLFRIKYPFSCSNDFRYIVPVLLSFAPFAARGIVTERIRVLRFVGYVSIFSFALFSALLILFL